jgi:hypothetical protein
MIDIFNHLFDSCKVLGGLFITKFGQLIDNAKDSPADDTDKVSAVLYYSATTISFIYSNKVMFSN